MTVEFYGQPNYARAVELLLRMEAERYGVKVKVGEQNGLNANAGGDRRCDGERGNHAVCGMAG